MRHYPHHIGDFNGATRHLTRVERSLYRDMIELYYDTEKPLPADDYPWLCKKVLAVTTEEKAAVTTILAEFFTKDADVYRNARCDSVIADYKAKINSASKAGKASAKHRKNRGVTPVERPLNASATNQEPITITNNQEPEEKPSPATTVAGLAKPPVPPCPHTAIIDLYHELLPTAQQVNKELWNGTRATHLQARWREKAERQNLDWWRRFFGYINQSDFLTGRTEPRQGKTPFLLTLAWIVNPNNLAKIHEGFYHRGRA